MNGVKYGNKVSSALGWVAKPRGPIVRLQFIERANVGNRRVPNQKKITTPSPQPKPRIMTSIIDATDSRVVSLEMDKCGINAGDDRIMNGQRALPGQFCYMALLYYHNESAPLKPMIYGCGGSLIQKRFVLTAAHCVYQPGLPKNVVLKKVHLGEYDTTTDPDACIDTKCPPRVQKANVVKTFYHPEYSSVELINDIGLVLLDQDARLDYWTICLICMPYDTLQFATLSNVALTISGWGTTESSAASKYLMWANVPFVDLATCEASSSLETRVDSLMCAGGGEQDSCTGDSGGPLMAIAAFTTTYPNGTKDEVPRMVQVGAVSYGPSPCAKLGVMGVYTHVGSFLDYILNTITNNNIISPVG